MNRQNRFHMLPAFKLVIHGRPSDSGTPNHTSVGGPSYCRGERSPAGVVLRLQLSVGDGPQSGGGGDVEGNVAGVGVVVAVPARTAGEGSHRLRSF